MINGTIVIAEVKTQSPSFKSERSWEELFEIADSVGDWISIHTNSIWGGSFELLAKARQMTNKPILAKGFHDTDDEVRRAVDLGADWVLVVGRIPGVHALQCLVEPYNLEGFRNIPGNFKIVWNSRDIQALRNGTKPRIKEPFSEVRTLRPHAWICQASNLVTKDDIGPGADAILVGTHLEAFAKSLE